MILSLMMSLSYDLWWVLWVLWYVRLMWEQKNLPWMTTRRINIWILRVLRASHSKTFSTIMRATSSVLPEERWSGGSCEERWLRGSRLLKKYVMIMRSHVLRSVLSVLVLQNVFLFYLRVLALRHVSLMTNDHRLLCVCTLSSHKVAIRFSSAARTMDDYVCINPWTIMSG